MIGRMVRRALTLATVFVATAVLLPVTATATANVVPVPLFSLTALLTVAPDLPAMSRRVLMSEAERIWRREGVRVRWPAAPSHEANAALRVLVIARPEALTKRVETRWPVAELVPQAGERAIAIASIAGAERVLLEATRRRLTLLERPGLPEYRLGVVLGRAVAHEIGHYLLATATHADGGLMRATIDAREFADPGATTFGLDEAAGRWVRSRLRDAESIDTPLPSTGFTYAAADNSDAPLK